ncbi:hypothetical protein CLOSTMETH_02623 [[Clostridium] methylpentosum DSM 5476]|uniref:Uncharacterized protein n=1 Tax=[Clostridium] methylpentosum DSM 5476 TaxID=537013 RepID=C0EFI1_9FIRM|nr:hypothetical protein CLOSTMETH_02623 [[Clostridium] methylpentosum DSM 5476]
MTLKNRSLCFKKDVQSLPQLYFCSIWFSNMLVFKQSANKSADCFFTNGESFFAATCTLINWGVIWNKIQLNLSVCFSIQMILQNVANSSRFRYKEDTLFVYLMK